MKTCPKCNKTKSISEFYKNNRSENGISYQCKMCDKQYNQKYEKLNSDKIRKRKQQYYQDNKKQIIKRTSLYDKNIRSKDPNHKIKKCLRNRIRIALLGICKSRLTLDLLGCTIEEFKVYLQQTAINNGYINFDIENYSGQDYHIDHIKPCALFDLSKPEEQAKCFHYTNMQILSSEDNLMKSNNY